MAISLFINFLVSILIYIALGAIGSKESIFWALINCISFFLLSISSPGKNILRLQEDYTLKMWHILAIAAWATFTSFFAPGDLAEKAIRYFCIFVFFFSAMEFFRKILRPDIERIMKKWK